MPDHETTAVLARHLRRLDGEACAALVADLWTARGFETSRDGTTVVATGRGLDRRIRVGTPGRSGVTDSPEVDLVVSPRGDRAAREAAEAASARFLDAAGLAEMLRYAVDRPTAAALCARHLGTPPEDLRPPLGVRLRARARRLGTRATAAGTTDRPVASASGLGTLPVFGLVVVLLVGAVAGVALTGTSGDRTDGSAGIESLSVPESTPIGDTAVGTATATPDPGPDPSVVPGLSDEGIVDPSALAAAHARGLLGRSYTLWMDTYRPSEGFPDGGRVQFDTDVAVAGDRFLVEENVGDGEDHRRIRTVYYDGEAWFVASETAAGLTYRRVTRAAPGPSPSPNPDVVALSLVSNYLTARETSVESGAGAEGPTLYRVVGRGTPPPMYGDGVRNYTAVALVDRDGVVRDLTVTYTVEGDEGSYRVRREWTYGSLGATVVEPPAWYDERFAANATVGPSPSPTLDG